MDRLWAENDDARVTGDPSLVVDVAGFEGPLDLLLHLARNQKVDLARISDPGARRAVSASSSRSARALRLELAADYLVMAAWLAYPEVEAADPQAARRGRRERRGTGGGAAVPAEAAGGHARRGRPAGQPQPARPRRLRARHAGSWSSSRSATNIRPPSTTCSPPMPSQRQRQAITNVRIAKRGVWSLKEAREILTRLIGSFERLDGARPAS